MRSNHVAAVPFAWLAAGAVLAGQGAQVWTFEADRVGAPPATFTLAAMRQGSPGAWAVRAETGRSWLAHAADPASRGFSIAVAPGPALRDVVVSARLRLAGGARAGGVVWRYVDPENYCAAILDLARRDVSMYRVSRGNRVRLDDHEDLELDPDAWHSLKAVQREDLASVILNGIRVFEERTSRGERAAWPGRVGLIAGGDAEVWFDDLRAEPPRDRRGAR
jgi:hypothetical protein